jgi:hypothetical protein
VLASQQLGVGEKSGVRAFESAVARLTHAHDGLLQIGDGRFGLAFFDIGIAQPTECKCGVEQIGRGGKQIVRFSSRCFL